MVFNYKKLLELHKQSGEKSIDFSRAIFGKESSLGPTYFKGKTEINTRHLEAMVRHYNVSYDYFFDDSTASHINIGNVVAHNRVGVGNVNINDDVKYATSIVHTCTKVSAMVTCVSRPRQVI